ncbi:MAG: uncharacterized protein JWO61_370 [Candidatus Saccharibacteria bacterium]|nr:uncharacterized protein [Candidatus Saccharibacteria bacterium]
MFIVGMLSWWYGAGWIERARLIRERLARTIDYFSIGLLVKTLFSPFRQISAGSVSGPIGVKWRAFLDRTVSRVIGAIIRIIIILIGCVTIVLHSIIGVITLVVWAAVPLFPFVGVLLFLTGWVPVSWM